MRLKRTVGALFLAGLVTLTLASALPARAEWLPTGFVTGAVYLDGQPLAGVEVWLGGERYTCTDESGRFSYKVVADEPFPAATGRTLVAGCSNPEFLDPVTGQPLVTQYYDHHDGSFTAVDMVVVPPDGEVWIQFDVVRAAATQLAVLQSHGAPVTNVDFVMAFDRNDPAFAAAYGHMPHPSQYAEIWGSGTGEIEMAPVRVPWNPAGVAELRYAAVTDVLVLAKEGAYGEPGAMLGRIADTHAFRDSDGDGVLEGPTLRFAFH